MNQSIKKKSADVTCVFAAALFLAACSQPKPVEKTKSDPPVYTEVDPATAGAVTGKVMFTGYKPPHKTVDMDEDPQCAHLHRTPVLDDPIAVNNNGTLANVFIYIKTGLEGKHFRPPVEPAVIDQKGCWFHPRILGIQTGQVLNVTNSDPLTHNIHPRPHENREWNQSQSPGAEPLVRKFIRPEVMVRVKCNIHGWMHAWIGVVDHPYFAVTGTDGTFAIPNIPPGTYTIEAWQEELGTQQQQVTVTSSGKINVDFRFKGE